MRLSLFISPEPAENFPEKDVIFATRTSENPFPGSTTYLMREVNLEKNTALFK
jgi:hypothetical protein